MTLGTGEIVSSKGMGPGRLNILQWMASHSWVYEQHKLDCGVVFFFFKRTWSLQGKWEVDLGGAKGRSWRWIWSTHIVYRYEILKELTQISCFLSLIFKHLTYSGKEIIFVTNFAIFIELMLTCIIQRGIVCILYLMMPHEAGVVIDGKLLSHKPVFGQQKENTNS